MVMVNRNKGRFYKKKKVKQKKKHLENFHQNKYMYEPKMIDEHH